ncbi:NB-ARC domain-containing protein [Parafrankia irregularis]|uniref:NB-ARC domain-containing protein n=1 Tax=Parafrankia irregularis TaxID=795642 RepID=A0A0S4QW72_9ACTN|nr:MULTISPECIES: FxSxx-COOH system tetratricopeptide repeat protein [Parafrankia]MBE3200004.1 toll/interleukin-1 receptor domain-containing protein [Parafrankia sp. CH37]CUU59250.1 NB-ARC domain-containing protein [Parafrankia irregularis]
MGTGVPAADGADTSSGLDFFVSYTPADRVWAEWIAWQLEAAGYRTTIGAWDFTAGSHVAHTTHRAISTGRTVAVLSQAYLCSVEGNAEWQAAWTADPSGRDRRLLVVRVQDCAPPGLLGPLAGVDLFDLDEDDARTRLLAAVTGQRAKPPWPPAFPGPPQMAGQAGERPRFPGLPPVWNVPARLATFTGRRHLLDAVHTGLSTPGGRVAVTALRGLGGVGKTQLAIEYAWRHAGDYQLVWWINAEQHALIADQLAALAASLELPATGNTPADAAAVLTALTRRDHWLLIFDNAGSAEALRRWLPAAPTGHVLLTSRAPQWGALATPVDVDVFDTDDALAFLTRRVPDLTEATTPGPARRLGTSLIEELGGLPLALEQAAAYLEATGTTPDRYLHAFRSRRTTMLAQGKDLAYDGTIDTCWSLALERLNTHNPDAAWLLTLTAHLGPDPIPLAWLTPEFLTRPTTSTDSTLGPDLDTLVGDLRRYSLIRRDKHHIQIHRLVAAVVRARTTFPAAAHTRRLLTNARPTTDHRDPTGWPDWAELAAHTLTAPGLDPTHDPAADHDPPTRALLLSITDYLRIRADYHTALALARDLHHRWAEVLGPDDPDTLRSASGLAMVLALAGERQTARQIYEDTLTRQQQILGPDHPDTLHTASGVAGVLFVIGEHQAARQLHEDTLTRQRQIPGPDHPDTLHTASGLAAVLAAMGELQAARQLHEDTLTRQRQTLGPDDFDTMSTASGLATVLATLGERQAARQLFEDTLTRRRRTLGPAHPDTLFTAIGLAMVLAAVGELQAARQLLEDTVTRRRRILGPDDPVALQAEEALRWLKLPAVRLLSRWRKLIGAARPLPTDRNPSIGPNTG